jgi:hypothetical protein
MLKHSSLALALLFVTFCTLLARANATQVRISEPESSIVIARQAGNVITIAVKEGDTVDIGSVILVMKNTLGTSELITKAAGVVKHLGPQVVIDKVITPGNFIVEIEEPFINGVLSFDSSNTTRLLMEVGKDYCCLQLGELALTVDIIKVYKTNAATVYFFTVPLESSELKKIVKDGKLSDQPVSFAITNTALELATQ